MAYPNKMHWTKNFEENLSEIHEFFNWVICKNHKIEK